MTDQTLTPGRDPEKRQAAYKLFCRIGNKSEVARQLGLAPSVVFRWAKDDEWESRLAELKKKLTVFLNFKEQLLNNEIMSALAKDLDVLDVLQGMALEPVVQGEIRPKTWSDVLRTLDLVMKHKDRILGRAKEASKPGPAAPEELPVTPLLGSEDVMKHVQNAIGGKPSEEVA
jgi:hypothetical protein